MIKVMQVRDVEVSIDLEVNLKILPVVHQLVHTITLEHLLLLVLHRKQIKQEHILHWEDLQENSLSLLYDLGQASKLASEPISQVLQIKLSFLVQGSDLNW